MGQGLFQRVHVADRPAFLRAITDAGARREPANVTVRLRDEKLIVARAPGPRRELAEPRFIWADLRAYPAIGEHPKEDRIEVVAVMRDVTEQKAREEELECARIGAEEADRSKSRFLATVSHELRTPLNAVIGFSEMLANPDLSPKDPARIREYARIIHASGAHLLDMVNSFLDASRIESGRFELKVERFDLAELVRSACAIVDVKSAESGVRLGTVAPMEGVTFEGDRRACRQIVINLVSNAVKFTPKGGRVKVQLRRVGSLIELSRRRYGNRHRRERSGAARRSVLPGEVVFRPPLRRHGARPFRGAGPRGAAWRLIADREHARRGHLREREIARRAARGGAVSLVDPAHRCAATAFRGSGSRLTPRYSLKRPTARGIVPCSPPRNR